MAWTNGAPSHTTKAQRARIMARDGRECQIRGPGCEGAATDVDHIDNRRGPDYDKDQNLQAVCRPCHNTKTQREAAARRGNYKRKPAPPIGSREGKLLGRQGSRRKIV